MDADSVIYDYRDQQGRVLYQVVRHTPKRFEIFSGDGHALRELPRRTVLYRLPQLIEADPATTVFVTEGEKDADRLARLGLVATTNCGGCRHGDCGWLDEYADVLRERHVVILPDNDRPGIRRGERWQRGLLGRAATVFILKLPRLRRAEDVSDWLDFRGGTRDELLRLLAQTRERAWPVPRQGKGGHRKRESIFRSPLAPSEKLLLLAIQHHDGGGGPLTAPMLADATGLHRVTVQRLIGRLRRRELLSRSSGRLVADWERIN